jgi:hypothetical protein
MDTNPNNTNENITLTVNLDENILRELAYADNLHDFHNTSGKRQYLEPEPEPEYEPETKKFHDAYTINEDLKLDIKKNLKILT